MSVADGGFWAFSLAVYARPGVSAACLRCQDEAGADVNLLLFALWHAMHGSRLDAAAFAEAEAHVRPWREDAIAPLRAARRAMKGAALADFAPQALRARVAEAELDAERLEQAALERLRAPAPPSGAVDAAALARDNLAAYQAATGRALPEDACRTLAMAIG